MAEEITFMIRFYALNLSVAKYNKYIEKLGKLIKIIIERRGGWSNCQLKTVYTMVLDYWYFYKLINM